MKQVVQSVRAGELRVVDVPRPTIGPTEVLVRTAVSLLSVGTERAVRSLAGASLLGKARARPELVRSVVNKARTEGVSATVRSVRSRLDEEMPLGYSAAGRVVEVGEAVTGIRPGDRVATGGAGHAEYQVVAGNLAVPVPDGVSEDEAAFATVAAIALHGLRQADLSVGSRLCVVGLGLVGQLTVRLALAAGIEVVGIDVKPWAVERATEAGAFGLVESGDDTTAAVLDWTRGRGADAVVLTAATGSSDPARRAPALARDRATIVVVGDVGLDLSRTPFYEKELSLRFARSYGPGRYDRAYEEWAVDLPPAYVRWTEGRNLEAFCDLVAAGRVTVADLITHRFPVDQAADAYRLLDQGDEPYLGVQLTYPGGADEERGINGHPAADRVVLVAPRRTGGYRIGLLGAGPFARGTLVPALREAGFADLRWVVSASGRSARHLAERAGIERAASDVEAVLEDPDVDVVTIATPHDTHASFAVRALRAGKHVFCEKPLALSEDQLEEVESAWRSSSGQLAVGFNRRHAPAIVTAAHALGAATGPLVISYRVNAGSLPASHWYHDRRQGGRLLGEVCHFVDTCDAVVGGPPDQVYAVGSGRDESLLDDDLSVLLRYPDGSSATIAYGSHGHPSLPKERLEILGRGHAVVIDDYRSVSIDGHTTRARSQDKGHLAELSAFRAAIESGDPSGAIASITSMRATLAAAASLLVGVPVGLDGRAFTP